jgi:ubiquinone/menaquinone biosynthesis C-methylase UbiE
VGTWFVAGIAEQWRQGAEERNRYLAPATEAMFALARIVRGMRVLDLGTGAGDVAIMAAERVGPLGSVLATDASEEMVQSASLATREAGALNVTVRRMDARALDLQEASFDAVLARMVLMFVDDLTLALEGIARVLARGGRFAATTWSALANNPFHAAIIDAAREHGPLPEPVPEFVRAFRLSDPDALLQAAKAAGLREVEVRAVAGERRVPSIAEEVERQKNWPLVAAIFASLDDTKKERAWTEVERRLCAFERPDGGAIFPTEILVLGASR